MTKPILAAAALLGACATNTPIASLTGTWTGTATNNSTTQYTFRDDGTFQYGVVLDAGFTALATGSFTANLDTGLTLDAVFADGVTSNTELQFQTFYVDDTSLCDAGFTSEDATRGSIIGSFEQLMSSQTLDASGNPVGNVTQSGGTISFNDDGTFDRDNNDGNGIRSGTYTMAGSQVTTSITHNNVAAVESFAFVGGIALCDPVYTKQ